MAKLKSLYKDYFQKSRVFMYPALDIKRGVSVTPIQSHVAWEGRYQPHDRKLVCLYHLRDDDEYVRFEKVKLLGNRLFHDFHQIDDETGIYVFDFDGLADDWDHFLEGRYSKMSAVHKKKVKNFYGIYSSNFTYVDSFLNPDKYYGVYSELLDVDVELLKKVGELCSKPDMHAETLVYDTKPKKIKTYKV